MSGHSKWSTIKHKKAAKDAKRGALFTKLIKDIQVAAKMGGSDINANPRLKIAVQNAKGANMPSENIDRAIKKGAGELEGVSYNEYVYEGYGPGGIAFMVSVLTENRNRSAADIRAIFSKNGGNMAEAGSVSYLFERKGVITVPTDKIKEDELMELVLEAGADDLTTEDNLFQIMTTTENFMNVISALEKANIETEDAEVRYIANTEIEVDEKTALQCLTIMEKLEDYDDVQDVYANFDIPDNVMEQISAKN